MYVVVDTNVLVRSLTDGSAYSRVRDSILKMCDVIAVSGKILKEYQGKVSNGGMTQYIFERKLREIENRGKLIRVPESTLQLQNIEKRPNDRFDEKFLQVAVAREAGCIITTDTKLLELDPYKSGSISVRILRPEEYPEKLSHD